MSRRRVLDILAIVILFLFYLTPPAWGTELSANDINVIKKHEGEFVTVTGNVYSTYKAPSGKVRFLNFGPDHRTAFTVVIFTSDLNKFTSVVGEPTEYYKDKKVKVEGRVKLYKGKPEIIANSPDQIAVIK